MVTFLNGAFGIGKSTVARSIRRQVPGTALFDPEIVGYLLRRIPRWIPLRGSGTDDYQDLHLWRRSIVYGVRCARLVRESVIVPMAFSNRSYFEGIRKDVSAFEPHVLSFCLIAPFEIVRKRLLQRGGDPIHDAWQFRRAQECCVAHHTFDFGEPIATDGRSVEAVVDDLVRRLVSTSNATVRNG